MNARVLLLSVLAMFSTGCASIVSDSEYDFQLNSTPQDASFTVTNRAGDEVHSGSTPATFTIKSGAGYFKPEKYIITLKKDGYNTKVYTLECKLDGWYWGNFAIGGPLGMLVVDPLTGAMYKPAATSWDAKLNPAGSSAESQGPYQLTVASMNSLTPEQQSQLLLLPEQP